MWLEFHKEIVRSLLNQDGLVVLGKGLGIRQIFTKMLQVYSTRHNLVFVLNVSTEQAAMYREMLMKHGVSLNNLPRDITNVNLSAERIKIYKTGGCFFITSRILVVDLLNRRLDAQLITGMLIHDAHRITETCVETFVVRLLKESNRTSFIKAFSDQATSFSSGFSKLEQTMKYLFLQKVWLFPRFHDLISTCFDQRQPNVIEIELPLTPKMRDIQQALLVAIETCLMELKKTAKHLDASELTVQNAIMKQLHVAIRKQLDPVWHKLPPKPKQLVSDLATLRQLLCHLTDYDAISFYCLLNTHKSVSSQQLNPSLWLFTEAADRVFTAAKDRLYSVSKTSKPFVTVGAVSLELQIELNPKWVSLLEVLAEIQEQRKTMTDRLGGADILIMAKDERTCAQIRESLYLGGTKMIKRRFARYLADRCSTFSKFATLSIEQQLLLETCTKLQKELSIAQAQVRESRKQSKKRRVPDGPEDAMTDFAFGMSVAELEIISLEDQELAKDNLAGTSSSERQCHLLDRQQQIVVATYAEARRSPILDDLNPTYVILFDPNVPFIRQLEVFNAENNQELQVYFLVYEESAEQQAYLNELSAEKDAFERLIHQKAHMLPTNIYEMVPSTPTSALSMDTRTGGRAKQTEAEPLLIIVDVREFRSALPSFLHRDGLDIRPVTLEIGDFILTPDICVERKSVSDLYGSFKSGRLFNQLENMCKYYKTPVLLIEFTPEKSFSLQDPSQLGPDISPKNISSKLTLLTLHFPHVRILWSRSPHETVKLFKGLKAGKAEPNLEEACAKGSGGETSSTKSSGVALEMLMKMPGVTKHNFRKIVNRVKNLAELSQLTLQDLEPLIGTANAKQLHTFLHKRVDV